MDIFDILKRNGFEFSKRYGQNFITDTNLLSAIALDAGICKDDIVVEIGAGAGTLTRELAKRAKKVISFEIDKRLSPVLNEVLSDCDNVNVVFADVLDYSCDKILDLTGGKYKLVANLPYYITTPIIFKFIDDDNLVSLTVMIQKEVAQRICAAENTAEYGAITAQIRAKGEAATTRHISRKLFTPQPNVDSAILRLDICPKSNVSDFELLKKIIASAFAMRRKTFVNNIIKDFSMSRLDAEKLLASVGIDKQARGESIGIEGFIKLCNAMNKYSAQA